MLEKAFQRTYLQRQTCSKRAQLQSASRLQVVVRKATNTRIVSRSPDIVPQLSPKVSERAKRRLAIGAAPNHGFQSGNPRIARLPSSSQGSVPTQMSKSNSGPISRRPAAPVRQFTPGLPDASNDFVKENIQKQQRSNFHSSSLNRSISTMVAERVNKTALHPGGVEYVALPAS